MLFVLANRVLLLPGGTEIHLATLAEQLQRLGHEVVVYSPELGTFADELGRRGIKVEGTLRRLPEDCDVIFSQDSIVAYDLAHRYPNAFSVFRICGDVFDFQSPPQLDGIVDLVVVLSNRYARLARAGAVRSPVLRLPAPIDTERLVPTGPLRERPEHAVLLGNYREREELIRTAWESDDLTISRVGAATPAYDVAAALADADIVVAKSRAALDAMACGRAVYVFDLFGGDGWVTPDLYPTLEADNFAGQATSRIIDRDALARDLGTYRPDMGPTNRDLVLQHHDPRDHAIAFLEALPERTVTDRANSALRELGRLTALSWSWEQTAREFRTTFWPLQAHTIEVEARAKETAAWAHTVESRQQATLESIRQLEQQRDADRAELDAIRATRAWRLVTAYWRLKQRLRSWAR